MNPRYIGRHSGGRPYDANAPKAPPHRSPRLASRSVGRHRVKKIALWVTLAVCLAASLAVIAGLMRGFYAMDHPPGGWCQDNSATYVHR